MHSDSDGSGGARAAECRAVLDSSDEEDGAGAAGGGAAGGARGGGAAGGAAGGGGGGGGGGGVGARKRKWSAAQVASAARRAVKRRKAERSRRIAGASRRAAARAGFPALLQRLITNDASLTSLDLQTALAGVDGYGRGCVAAVLQRINTTVQTLSGGRRRQRPPHAAMCKMPRSPALLCGKPRMRLLCRCAAAAATIRRQLRVLYEKSDCNRCGCIVWLQDGLSTGAMSRICSPRR